MMDVFSTITFRDTAGGRQILLLGEARTTSVDIARYEMPPSPPAGVMDVRFMSGRMLELVDKSGDQEFGISVNSVQYPLKVEWSIADPGLSPLLVAGMQEILMTSKGSVRIVSAPSGYVLKVRSEINLPTQYALMQNYPNPFNPTTQICYDLPVTSHVVLKVYNILGQEVKTLKQGEEEAGRYTVQWNGTNNTGALVGSGVYLYRIEAKSSSGPTFMQTMKVVLLK